MSARVIVHLTTFLQGGAGRAVTLLACAQRRAGHDVVVVTSHTPAPGYENYPEYLDTIAAAGVRLIQVDSLFKRDDALNRAALDQTRAALQGQRPQLVHAHAAVPARIGLGLASGGCQVVQTMHGWSRHKTPDQVAQDLDIMRQVDLVVFPSAAAAEELRAAGGSFRATAIVPCGIPAEASGAALPAGLDHLQRRRAQGTRVLVTIGSLTRQKNHAAVIDALPLLVERHDVMALLVGEGPEMSQLRARTVDLGVSDRVHFAGYVAEASSVLAIADVLVQPSLTESFGIAVAEAFRAGVPVVANNIPALAELLAGGACGWMFDAFDADDLVRTLDRGLRAPQAEVADMTARARRRFEDLFTERRMVDGYAQAYEQAHVARGAAANADPAAD